MKKYFGTDGIRGPVGKKPITTDWILKLGWAAGLVFASLDDSRSGHSKDGHTKIIIGRDTRISGYLLETALEAGLISAGADIHLLGTIPTPAIAFLTRELNADAGIVISASHNPFQDNGIKFFDAHGYKISDETELMMEAQCEQAFSMVDSKNLGKVQMVHNSEERYINFCKNTFPETLSLKGLKLVVDCANGATYRVAPAVFKTLGASVIEMGNKPDGFNINDHCGSTYLDPLVKRVLEEKADLGIAFDGDGDRVMMVDNNGEIVDGDELLFIIARWYSKSKQLTGGIVGTVMSNLGLEYAIQRLGLPFMRSAVGDHNILELAREKHWNLGGESSGHIICLDNSTTGDGIVAALQVLASSISLGLPLAELKLGMNKYPQALINVPLTSLSSSVHSTQPLENPLMKKAIMKVETRLKGKGRILIRASGTEPLIRVMVEGEDASLVQSLAQLLADQLQKC